MSEDKLKQAGLKITGPRSKVLDILASSKKKHLSAEDIYKKLQDANKDVSLATVYRVLGQFEETGIVNKHFFEGEHAIYEMAPNDHHDHIICVECGRVEEFFDDIIEQRQEKISEEKGFTLTSHSLHIFGICNNCEK